MKIGSLICGLISEDSISETLMCDYLYFWFITLSSKYRCDERVLGDAVINIQFLFIT